MSPYTLLSFFIQASYEHDKTLWILVFVWKTKYILCTCKLFAPENTLHILRHAAVS